MRSFANIKRNFSKEIKNVIDKTLNGKVSNEQVNELVQLLSLILKKQINRLDFNNYAYPNEIFFNNQNNNCTSYTINIILQPFNYPLLIPNTILLPIQPFPTINTFPMYLMPPIIPFPLLTQKQSSNNNPTSNKKHQKKVKKTKKSTNKSNPKDKIKEKILKIRIILQNPDSLFISKNIGELNDSYGESDDEYDEINEIDFSEYISITLLRIRHHLSITKNAVSIIDLLLKYACEKLIFKSLHFNKTNISNNEISSAVKSIMKGELANHAFSEGCKASSLFEKGEYNVHRPNVLNEYTFEKEKIRKFIDEKKLLNNATIDEKTLVYLSAVIEYLCVEIIDVSGDLIEERKLDTTIKPEIIKFSILNDNELNQLFSHLVKEINVNE